MRVRTQASPAALDNSALPDGRRKLPAMAADLKRAWPGVAAGTAGGQRRDRSASPCSRQSGHQKIRTTQHQTTTQTGELHRSLCPITVGIVVQRTRGAVVEDEVLAIGRTDSDRCTERAGAKRSDRRQRPEDGVLEFDCVVDDLEVADRVAIVQNLEQAVETEGIVAGPSIQRVMARAADESVVAASTGAPKATASARPIDADSSRCRVSVSGERPTGVSDGVGRS